MTPEIRTKIIQMADRIGISPDHILFWDNGHVSLDSRHYSHTQGVVFIQSASEIKDKYE